MLSRYNRVPYNVMSPMLPLSLWGVPSQTLPSSVNRLFKDFERAFAGSSAATTARRAGGPSVQLRDRGDSIAMVADLPGLRLEDIELSIEGETVTLKATSKPTPLPEGFKTLRRERQPVAIEWAFQLPYAVDADAASATLEQGRLAVMLPKAPEAKPRTIAVKAA
jgi:HSP20 family protein